MAFTFVTDKGSELIPTKKAMIPKDEKPVRAFSRGFAEGALGSYGDTLSLIPGYPSGEQLPGQKAKHALEAQASDLDLAALNIDSDEGVFYPPLPTRSQVDKILTQQGIPKEEKTEAEKGLGRFGRNTGSFAVTPGVGLANAAKIGFTSAGAGELARKAGLGEAGQALAEIGGSLRFKGKPITPQNKISQPRVLTKDKNAKKAGFISDKLLSKRLDDLGEEASKLAADVGSDHPTFKKISNAIDTGVPIKERFQQKFSSLEELAKNVDQPVNSNALDSFLSNEAHRYTGVGADTDLSKFVSEQITGWQKSGGDSLYKMFRRYRLNNDKWKEIQQSVPHSSMLPDSSKQKMNFLTRMNDSIKDSIKSSFESGKEIAIPGQSSPSSPGRQWFNAFEKTNDAYSQFKNTQTVKRILDPILKGNVSEKDLNKFLSNQRNWEDITRFLGPEEGEKLHTLVEDVVKAKNALESLPKGDIIQDLTSKALLGLIPGGKKVLTALSIPKLWNWAKGRYYSSPEFQSNFHELVQGIIENNPQAIKLASDKIKSEDKPKRPITFIPNQK